MTSPHPPALSTTLDDLLLLQTTQQTQLTPAPPTPLDLSPFPLDFDTLLPLLDSDEQGLDVYSPSLEMFNQASYAHYQPPPAPLNPLPPAQQQPPASNGQQQAAGGGGAGSGVGQFSFGAFSQPTQQQGFYGGNQKQPSMAMGFPGGVNGGFVGSQAGDFELFGSGGGPSPVQPTFATPAYNPYAVPSTQQRAAPPPPYPVPIPPSPASTSSISGSAQNSLSDYPPLPDLIPDAGSPASGHSQNGSPPSPRRFSLSSQSSSNGGGGFSSSGTTGGGAGAFSFARPPFLSAAAAGAMGKGGSFRTALGVSPSSSASSFGSFGSFGAGIERPASVPIPEAPRPVRRKTQERRDWPSFYSSGSSASSSSSGSAYMPFAPSAQVTDEPASYATPTLPQQQQQQRPTPFDPSSSAALNFSLSPSPAYPHHQPYSSSANVLPHTDHPLLPSEQTDLLERVRRDLLELSDVDLSSIKGPLRALALSGTGAGTDRDATPTPSSVAAQLTPKTGLLRSPAAQALRDEDALSAGTVSPQEAFLDYPSVDSRLHDPRDPLFIGSHGERGEFGVGVGASLFAPLPGQQATKPVPPPPAPAVQSSSSPKTAPTSAATASPRESHRRGPHPFSVPQNAVTWAQQRSQSGHHWLGGVVDGDADDEDGDFSASAKEEDGEGEGDEGKERREEEVRERARLGEGFGRFRKEEADLRRLKREEEEGKRVKDEEEEVYGVRKGEEEDKEGTPRAEGMVSGKTPAFAPPLPPHQQQQNQSFTFAPPLSLSQPSQQSAIPQSLTPQQQSLLAAAFAAHQNAARSATSSSSAVPPSLLPALPLSNGDGSGTTTPRRTAAASALAGLGGTSTNTFASPAPAPVPSSSFIPPLPPSSESTRPQRQRKRSRIARAAYGDDSGEEGAGEDAADGDFVAPPPSTASSSAAHDGDGHESDGSYRSSASSFSASAPSSHRRTNTSSSAAPPPKRRRRAPPASSSSAAAGPNAIRCDHSNADGTVCGVAFRRPYDLARHKETIHGEGLGGEKLARAKEWRCEQCGGTFSRKDALLRHGRIRGHVTGA